MTQNTNPWGTDLWLGPNANGVLDLDPSGRTVTGLPVLIQSVIMRQSTPTGSLVGAPDECFDLRGFLSAGMTATDIQALQGFIQSQLLRDDRILACSVSASYTFATSTLTVVERIQSSLGPFTLTLSVSQVSSSINVNVLYAGGSST